MMNMTHNQEAWRTWNVRSVLSHVLMPWGFSLNVAVKSYATGAYLKEALIGRHGQEDEQIIPGPHTMGYTRLDVTWQGIRFTVESAAEGRDFTLLITTHTDHPHAPKLYLESGFLWNRPGWAEVAGNTLIAHLPSGDMRVYASAPAASPDPNVPTQAPYLCVDMAGQVCFSTREGMTAPQARALMDERTSAIARRDAQRGDSAALYEAIDQALQWDTIYDAWKERVISPVSRLWSIGSGGWVLFCWDNYFAALMAALTDRALSYANLLAITDEATADGFVPNFAYATGNHSKDRSQPPVGSFAAMEIYRVTGEKWPLERVYPALLRWNEWFAENRMDRSGALCWGSNPRPADYGNYWDTCGVNDRFGAALESGLDNSPMYDDIPFDKAAHRLMLADVGLTGLYIMDCEALINIAHALGRESDIAPLQVRLDRARQGLDTLWCEEKGIYLNRRTDTGAFSERLSPTLFYALMDRTVPRTRAQRMMREHYWNPEEFAGDYILPTIARNDPAFPEQDYWRGRVWAPVNFLTYVALRRHGLSAECADLSQKSRALLMKEYAVNGHIHENYNAITGEGCDVPNSDKYYHWGALLAFIPLVQEGALPHFDGSTD